MWRKTVAVVLALAVPSAASATPSRFRRSAERGIEKAGREFAAKQPETGRSRGRFWTGIALIAGGGVLARSAASSWVMMRRDLTTARTWTTPTTEKIRTAGGTRQCSVEESQPPPSEVCCC